LAIQDQYITWQAEVDGTTRGALADWIIAAHRGMKMLPETLYLAINLLDRMLSKKQCSLSKLQLLGITCLRIAAKYEETWCLAINQFVTLTEGAYTVKHINQAERYILGTLDWNLSSPGPMSWLRRASKAEGYDGTSRTVAKYLMEIAVVHPLLCETKSSLIAAAAIYLARLYLNKGEWVSPNQVTCELGYTRSHTFS
jgi:G2/mitotic-specific cyclin 2